ncbi:hypothetical protein DY000_02064408 [Brassica cretica]|uniref:Peptidase C1A papain C-terminal domain-containing protein n=1 Tax=Brassica cretica TaxID=69181 RepID=A0ABQ7AN39_BRACR|nr:hypothetical protein DY000_02064408 [Brassica cretica]
MALKDEDREGLVNALKIVLQSLLSLLLLVFLSDLKFWNGKFVTIVFPKALAADIEIIFTLMSDEVDGFEYIGAVNDNELRAIVVRQPVVGILRNVGPEFGRIGRGIYRSPTGSVDINFHQVLIIGYGTDEYGQPYWIIQNSYGEGWGEQGFGYVFRRGSGSEFYAVAYPKKRGLPREKDGGSFTARSFIARIQDSSVFMIVSVSS